jgi:glucosamine--fructose-6-phosphate aminotransferase (isomerizing)
MSRLETTISAQPGLVAAVLKAPAPSWMKSPQGRRIYLVGVGTNHHAAQLAAWFWCRAGLDARAVHSFDFATRPYRVKKGDLAVFLSHRGTKSYTLKAEALARRAGAQTIIITGAGSPWNASPRRLESGPMEITGAFTQSLTTTLAWLARLSGKPALLAPFRKLEAGLTWGPDFPAVDAATDVVLIGDGPREWVAREIALKLQEAAYLRARAFGLEEFLHGPRVSVDARSLVVCFSSPREPRWETALRYLATVEAPFADVRTDDWLAQLLWGQRFTVKACRRLRIDPDLLRTDDPRYRRAREELSL